MKRTLLTDARVSSLLLALFAGPLTANLARAQVAAPIPVAKAAAGAEAKPAKEKKPNSAFGNFGSSKEPVRIDAASLQVIDKEQKAIYSGDVVAIQGQTTLRCSRLTIYYSQAKKDEKDAAAAAPAATGSSIKKLDCDGPVSVVSSTQTATGDHGLFDAERETVTLTGNVVLADCENVQRGDKLVYNTRTGIANVTNNGSRRVQGVFTPGSDEKDATASKKTSCKDRPKGEPGKADQGKADPAKADQGKAERKQP